MGSRPQDFFNETRVLLLNCSSHSLPELPQNMGFRNLESLVVPYLKHGNLDWGPPTDRFRHWSDVRKDEVKCNFRPDDDKTATIFEIIILKHWHENILLKCFANMVTPHFFPYGH